MLNCNFLLPYLLGGACLLSTAGFAQEQAQRQTKTPSQSKKQPVKTQPLAILERHVENTTEASLTNLLESLAPRHKGKVEREKLTDRQRASGTDWRLDVFGDGSGAEFFDQAAANRSHSHGVEPAKAMSAQALEEAGRNYIDRYLSKVIVLRAGERLVPVATSFRTEGGVGADGRNSYSAVVANRVMFSREINGTPVVGAGSKVVVTFLNDGTVESFRYDWPAYTPTGRTQQLASANEVLLRIQRIAAVRTNTVPGNLGGYAEVQSITRPIALGANVRLENVKCGYYDPGYMNRDPHAPVQAGCYYHLLHTAGKGDHVTTAGYSGAVPAAEKYELDKRWPEVNVLSGRVVKGSPPPRNGGPSTKVEPVPPRPKQEDRY